MENHSQKELDAALQLIVTTINNCEKMQLKFAEGTSQYSLLTYISENSPTSKVVG